MSEFIIESKPWITLTTDDFFEIVRLRYEVYALEQRVAAEDFDEVDRAPTTQHWWIRRNTPELSGYLRILTPPRVEPVPPGSPPADWAVGRMVVQKNLRRQGLAQRLLQAAVAAHPEDSFVLHAQSYAQQLYEKVGFKVFDSPFEEAGIPHVRMYLPARKS